MRLTMRTNLAMRVLMYCAVNSDGLARSGQVAAACNASVHHVAQVVNQLATLGYLKTWRGRSGGIALARPAAAISVGDVFSHFEAELPLTECFDGQGNTCPLTEGCRLRDALIEAARAFYGVLARLSLEDLVCNNTDLETAFAAPACRPRLGGAAGPSAN